VIIPVYKEDLNVLEETLKSLAEQNVSMIIGLALEERETNSHIKYNGLIQKYETQFLKVLPTIHPYDLPNEIPGKASNCNYSARILTNYYDEHLQGLYPYVMITSCDCDSIWCKNYYSYLNYLCMKNDLKFFNHIVYSPNITNLRDFTSNHMITNWMSVSRMVATHGHFRRLGSTRCFTSEYHIPLDLLKRIDYWDPDLVHEDVHMRNKLAVLDEKFLSIEHTYLPCDNQTPTNIHSAYESFLLLWNQSLRWNLFVYDIYYLVHLLFLNVFKLRCYENFRSDSWKIIKEIVNNYENLFYFFVAPISNNLFWMFYLNIFNYQPYNDLTYFLLDYIQPSFIIIQIPLAILQFIIILNMNDVTKQSEFYSGKEYIILILGSILCPFLILIYQAINMTIAWIHTLKSYHSHSESAVKMVVNSKNK
jgi:hypothetical protein